MSITVNPFFEVGYEGAGLTQVEDPAAWLTLATGASLIEAGGALRPRLDVYLYGGIASGHSKLGLGGRIGPQIPLGRAGRWSLFPFLEQRVATGLGSYQVTEFPGREQALGEYLNGIGLELGCRMSEALDLKLGGHYLGGWTHVVGPDGTDGLVTGLATRGGGLWAGLSLNLNRLFHGRGGTGGAAARSRAIPAAEPGHHAAVTAPWSDTAPPSPPPARVVSRTEAPSSPAAIIPVTIAPTLPISPAEVPAPAPWATLTPAALADAAVVPAPAPMPEPAPTPEFRGNLEANPLMVPVGSDRVRANSVAPDIITQIADVRGYDSTDWDYAVSGDTLEVFLKEALPDDSAGNPIDFELLLNDGRVVPMHWVVEADKYTGMEGLLGVIGTQMDPRAGIRNRGSGLGNGGTAEGLGGFGTKGRGSGNSGYSRK